MKLLLVDTSGSEIGIGVYKDAEKLYETYAVAERSYNSRIMAMIEKALSDSGLTLEQIDIFGAALGPGSFTGIRVGISVMKAFAHALNKKFSGASSLDILAASAEAKTRVWAILDAGRGEVYAGQYRNAGCRMPNAGLHGKYLLLSREAFMRKLKPGDTVAGITDEEIIIELAGKSDKINVESHEHISMEAFARVITGKKDIKKIDLYKTAAVYIRPSEAEARRKSKKMEEAGKK